MQPNETLELKIDDLGIDGEGIAHYEGYTVFVPYALTGERVKAKLTYVKHNKNIAYAELKEITEPSPFRVKPLCNRFTRCGGCTLMHLEYSEQLKAKHKALAATLRKNAGYVGGIDEVVPSEPNLGYRNKVQLPFGMVNGKVAVGFYKESTRKVVSVTKCFLHGDWLERLIRVVLEYADRNKLSVYSHETGKGLLRHLVARMTGDKLCITIVVNGSEIPLSEELISALDKEFSDYSLYLSPNVKDTGVVMGDTVIPLKATPAEVVINGVKLSVNPFSFFQVNDYIRDKVYSRIAEEAAADSNTVFIDAYAGIGLTGAAVARAGATVYNIEIVKEAVEDGNALYEANGLDKNVVNILGDAPTELRKLLPEIRKSHNGMRNLVIYIDPPRKGISQEMADTLNEIALEMPYKLIYLSCNPATLSRDLKALYAFDITCVTPYDMFPHTGHLETFVSLVSKNNA